MCGRVPCAGRVWRVSLLPVLRDGHGGGRARLRGGGRLRHVVDYDVCARAGGGSTREQAVAVTIAGRRESGMGLRGVYGGGLGGGEGGSGEGWVRTQRGARLWFAGAACGYFFSAAASATSARDERCVHPGWRRGVGNEPWRGGRCAAPRRPAGGGGTRAPQRMSSLHILSATGKSAFFLRRCVAGVDVNSSRHTPRAYVLSRREAPAPRRGGRMRNDAARDAFRGPEIKLLMPCMT